MLRDADLSATGNLFANAEKDKGAIFNAETRIVRIASAFSILQWEARQRDYRVSKATLGATARRLKPQSFSKQFSITASFNLAFVRARRIYARHAKCALSKQSLLS